MIEERMKISGENALYHAFHLSDHFLRYQTIATLCKGKKVLDLSCGDGYGSYIISKSGAHSVTGVDTSTAAIASAQSMFSEGAIRFIQTATESIQDTLKGEVFDVIVSLKTIEHATSPARMVQAIKSLISANGIIVMSCPNDDAQPDIITPCHLPKYSYLEFKSMTEEVLGPATNSYIGTPLHGHALLPSDFHAEPGDKALSILKTTQLDCTNWLSPSQEATYPDRSNCSYYLLVWNGSLEAPSIGFSYQPLYGAMHPLHQIDTLTNEIKRMPEFERDVAALREQLRIQQDENIRLSAALDLARETQADLEERQNILKEENCRLGIALATVRNQAAQSNTAAVSIPLTKWEKRRKKWANSLKKRIPSRR